MKLMEDEGERVIRRRRSSRSVIISKSCGVLIVIGGIERYAFKGVTSNLVTYLSDVVKMSNSRAAMVVNTFNGFTFILPLFSAPFADSYWDRFFTILASSSLYFVGLVGLTCTAFVGSHSTTKSISLYFLYTSLSLVALGLGVLSPSLQAFGADQLDHDLDLDRGQISTFSDKTQLESNRKTKFFQWSYFGVCTGSLLGVTVVAYIQDTFGWVLGFAVPTISMLVLIILFLCGSGIYFYTPQPFQRILEIVKRNVRRKSKMSLVDDHDDLDAMELELQEKPLCNCTNNNIETTTTSTVATKTEFSILENLKLLLRLLPIWTMLLMFAVIYQQPATFFTKQGLTMKRNIGPNFKIPPSTLQSSITLSIILLMPLYDKILIPITQKFTKNQKGISIMERMGIGMFLSIIAIVIAALVERKRLEISEKMKNLQDSESEFVEFSIFWLLPQYILLGISDIFTVVGMQEFFYSEVPAKMRTMGFALYTSVFGVGSFVSAALISVIETKHNWFDDDMSKARLDNYYWLLVVISGISFLMYLVLCKHFKSRCDDHDDQCEHDDHECDDNF